VNNEHGIPIRHTVNVVVTCEHCDEPTRVRMTPQAAREQAAALLASADDLGLVSFDGPKPQG
jgi:hypothetical protein